MFSKHHRAIKLCKQHVPYIDHVENEQPLAFISCVSLERYFICWQRIVESQKLPTVKQCSFSELFPMQNTRKHSQATS